MSCHQDQLVRSSVLSAIICLTSDEIYFSDVDTCMPNGFNERLSVIDELYMEQWISTAIFVLYIDVVYGLTRWIVATIC